MVKVPLRFPAHVAPAVPAGTQLPPRIVSAKMMSSRAHALCLVLLISRLWCFGIDPSVAIRILVSFVKPSNNLAKSTYILRLKLTII